MIIVIISCKNKKEATQIARQLLVKKLVGCAKITHEVDSLYLWPPKSGKIEETGEVMLICKTLESKWQSIEKEVLAIHSYENPEIYAIPTSHVSQKYFSWLTSELV